MGKIISKYYSDKPDGIPGNDDTGTMSTWLIFSMLGFYPDCPGDPSYTLTAPVFDRVTLHLDKRYYPAGDLTIVARRQTPSAHIISSMTLGDKKWNSYRISHKDLVKGGTLVFNLK